MERVNKLIENLSIPPQLEREKVMPIVSVTAAAAILYSTYKLVSNGNKKDKNQELKHMPSPSSSYPYIGHMFALGNSPCRQITKWHKELGHIFKLRMGIQTWILIDDPVLAQKVFVNNGTESSDRPHSTFAYEYYSIKGKGIGFASASSKSWKEGRKAVLSIIAPKVIDTVYMEPIKKEAVGLVDRLIEYSKLEKGVNPTSHLHLNSMNIIYMAAFGKKFEGVEDPEFLAIETVTKKAMGLAGIEQDLPNFLPILTILDYCTGKHAIMKNFIDNERNPLYQKLIKEALERDGDNFVKSLSLFDITEEERLVIMSDLINGGTDTVSVTLSWIIAILCNYQLVQRKAIDEIDQFIRTHGRLPEFSERTEFPYCNSVIKECMRFKPTTPFCIPHATNKDIVVDGYFIPKGVTVITSLESMHQNPEVYSEPLRFYPERFLNNLKTMDQSAKGKVEERDQYNFGWGRRMCAAIHMAEVVIFNSLVQMLSRSTIEPFRDVDGKEHMPDIENHVITGLTLTPQVYKVNFVERISSLIK